MKLGTNKRYYRIYKQTSPYAPQTILGHVHGNGYKQSKVYKENLFEFNYGEDTDNFYSFGVDTITADEYRLERLKK